MGVFDPSKFYINAYDLTCAPTTFSAGRGVGGFKQNTLQNNHYWRGSFSINSIFGKDILAYRGFIASLNGQSGVFDLPVCDPYRVRSDLSGDHAAYLTNLGFDVSTLCGPDANAEYGEPLADGTCFVDNTGYKTPTGVPDGPVDLAPAGSTSFTLSATPSLVCGNYFCTRDYYLHIVTDVSAKKVTFNPPLRRDIAAGELIEANELKIKVKLSSDTSGTPTHSHGRIIQGPSLDVEEVITR